MAIISGVRRWLARLRGMRGPNVERQVVAALYSGGQDIEIDAERSITEGSISGKGHIPSLPGEAPNRDTGHLDTNIETTIEAQNPPTVHVTSHAAYSSALEFGTSKMGERPFMRPAVERNRKKVGQKVAAAVKIAVRKG